MPTSRSEARSRPVRDAAVAGFWCGGIFGLLEIWSWISSPVPAGALPRLLAALFPAIVFWSHAGAGAAVLAVGAVLARGIGQRFGPATWFAAGTFLLTAGARLAAVLAERSDPEVVSTGIETLAVAAVSAGAAGAAARGLPADARSRRFVAKRGVILALALLFFASSDHLPSPTLGYVVGAMLGTIALLLPRPATDLSRASFPLVATFFLLVLGRLECPGPEAARPERPDPRPAPLPAATGPNLLLLTVDALRADALGCYGNPRARTPSLDALAARGVAFERAYATAPWTLASFASLLHGRFPSELGVGRTGEEEGRVLEAFLRRRIAFGEGAAAASPGIAALASYESAAIVTNFWCDARFGLDLGFETHERLDGPRWFAALRPLHVARLARRIRPDLADSTVRADGVTSAAIAAMDRLRGRRFFLWAHYLDPHLPYDAPGSAHRVPQTMLEDLRSGRLAPSLVRERVRSAYGDEVAFADREIGRLLEWLRSSGLARETFVALTADHGEEFFEHGGFEHGHSLHDEVLRVPLLLAFPDGRHAGRRVPGTVSLLDLAPTLLDVAGSAAGPEGPGLSLLPLLEGKGEPRLAFSESLLYGDEAKSLRADRWRLLLRQGESEPLVLDYARDPLGEPAAAAGNEEVRALAARLLDWAGRMRQEAAKRRAESSGADAEAERALRALGYIR